MIPGHTPGFRRNATTVIWFRTGTTDLLHHELDLVTRFQRLSRRQTIEHEEALERAVGDCHTRGKPFRRVGCRHRYHLDTQGLCAVDFGQRHAAEAIDRFAEGALAFSRLLLGGENKSVNLAAEA